MHPSQPFRELSAVQLPAGNSRVNSRVWQSSLTVMSAFDAPAIGLKFTSALVSRLAPGSVNEDSSSPFLLIASELNVALGSPVICGFNFTFHPQWGSQLRSNRATSVLVVCPAPGGRRNSKLASGGALKSSIVLN